MLPCQVYLIRSADLPLLAWFHFSSCLSLGPPLHSAHIHIASAVPCFHGPEHLLCTLPTSASPVLCPVSMALRTCEQLDLVELLGSGIGAVPLSQVIAATAAHTDEVSAAGVWCECQCSRTNYAGALLRPHKPPGCSDCSKTRPWPSSKTRPWPTWGCCTRTKAAFLPQHRLR